ncbi:MAG: sulfite exporter TauE/SafE family protein [gamma proteobacterium symbiont of Taylorina sp.]|nr:sulfite exporter TauE/SafE family protein [gamma proteobacterium symbiont of Taylorina sp.]
MLIILTLLVFALAFIFSMLGLGGAMLYIPVFTWFGFDLKGVAIPTGLFLNSITALSAAIFYYRAKMIDVRGTAPMIITAIIGAPIGAHFTHLLPTDILIILFSIAMIAAGSKMLYSASDEEPTSLLAFKKRAGITGIAGFFIGFTSGLLGTGGGFLFVPLMIAVGYPTKHAAANSAFIVLFSSFSGFLGHASEGHFNWQVLIFCAIAAVIGAQIGGKVMKEKMKARWIKQIFGVLLIFVAIKFSWNLFF